MSQIQFYSFRLHTRENELPLLHHGGRLFQQYLCDAWVSSDQNRLRWIENNQRTLPATLYSGLEDAFLDSDNALDLHDVGQRVVLPSSYIGGPRYMNLKFHDAMAIARFFHGFDVFITFTSNPNWPEIKKELFPGQSASDRPDLVVRVFRMYQKSLLHDLTKSNFLGVVQAHVHSVEFQKRGLPHMHLLLTLMPRYRPTSPEQVDAMVCARWPDPRQQPTLFRIVMQRMVHGPCGPANPHAPCMIQGKCSKGFPKPFQENTVLTRDGYPIYARPNDGRAYEVRGFYAHNWWIVPYNPLILARSVSSSFSRVRRLTSYLSQDMTLISTSSVWNR